MEPLENNDVSAKEESNPEEITDEVTIAENSVISYKRHNSLQRSKSEILCVGEIEAEISHILISFSLRRPKKG